MTQAHIPVLDHGFVALESHMGSDLTVVNAARVSFAKRSNWKKLDQPDVDDQEELSQSDARLIQYLAWHEHWTPFGHPQITLRLKMPIFVARQWMRSNVGIVYNEVSRRYVDDPPEFHTPEGWRARPEGSIKQGSSPQLLRWCHTSVPDHGPGESRGPEATMAEYYRMVRELYESLLVQGVAPEQARMVLPLSMYTEFWMTGSLAAWARVVGLRADPHAQWEVQQYAKTAGHIIKPLFPVSWEVLLESQEELVEFRRTRYTQRKAGVR